MQKRLSRLGRVAAAVAVLTAIATAAPTAAAADPATPTVRIEGLGTTLFEGPVLTDGHDVRASSDDADRHCDGTNNGMNPAAGPTATASSVDAMTIAGLDFDGDWYPGFDDYYITQWGTDHEQGDTQQWWGILVNGQFTPVGGCQFQVTTGDQVLWSIDAFTGKPFLDLDVVTDDGPVAEPTATTSVGVPLAVKVTGTTNGPDSNAAPQAGASIAPVTTAPNGIETVHPSSADTVVTDADGLAQLVFSTPGWHRVKAVGTGLIRSPRLDVCVLGGAMTDCGTLPFDAQARSIHDNDPPPPTTTTTDTTPTTTPTTTATTETPPTETTPTTTETTPTATTTTPATTPPAATPPADRTLRLQAPSLTDAGLGQGETGVRWAVTDPGVGVRGWTIEARDQTAAKPAWRTAASGTSATSAVLKLGTGRTWQLRLTVTDTSGRATTAAIGSALVPVDDRRLDIKGTGSRASDPGAWRHTVTALGKGASVRVHLPAGRPALVLRGGTATLDVTYGGAHRTAYRVSGKGEVLTPRRTTPGPVTVRVRTGSVKLDGVGVRP